MCFILIVAKVTFSILTSDRESATEYDDFDLVDFDDFQYPNLGS